MRHQSFTGAKHTRFERQKRLSRQLSSGGTPMGERGSTMKRALALGLVVVAVVAVAAVAGRTQSALAKPAAGSLVGTGATFPYPLISKWIPAVDDALGLKITYTATGSGAGIAQITARTVDFGASDAPLSPDQLAACKTCVVIPSAPAGMPGPYNR